MKKIINDEKDYEMTKKAKKILKSIKVASLAGVIAVGSLVGAKGAKADQVTNDAFSTELTDELDSKFTWEFDAGIQEQPYEVQVAPQVVPEVQTVPKVQTVDSEIEIDLEALDNSRVVESDELEIDATEEVPESEVPFDPQNVVEEEPIVQYIPGVTFAKYNIDTKAWEWSDKRVIGDGFEYLQFIEDIDPATVDENYTGVAPIGYYGSEHIVKNYGDASNDEEVMERAMMVWNAFHKANEEVGGPKIVDPTTGKEYEPEKLCDIIKTLNGSYIAKDGADAKLRIDDINNFAFAFLNDNFVIEDVVYKTNSDVIVEDDVINHTNLLENVDLGHLLMGDSSNGPLIEWLGDKVKAMFTATDIEESLKIFDEYSLAVTAITSGNGFVINGVKYDIKDLTNVNDYVFMLEVQIGQIMRNRLTQSGYIFNKEYVGLTLSFLTDVFNQYNPECADVLVEKMKSSGLEVYEGVIYDGNGINLNIYNHANNLQIKLLEQALENKKYGIKFYQESYLEHYPEYAKAKDNGTYEDVLESDYVYKLK